MNCDQLIERLNSIKKRIAKAAEKANRNPAEVKIIAVSKNHPAEKIDFFQSAGIEIFGENRVQELLEKDEKINNTSWHFIGHLQRNKVKYLLRMDNCKMIQSLDSWRLAREIDKRARKNNRIMPVLLEVNVAGDENKFGLSAAEVDEFMEKAQKLKNIEIEGLMTIAPYLNEPEELRPFFRQLAELRKNLQSKGFSLKELSMGMTNDFEVAIEEGATMVRIGSGLFGMRDEYNEL